MAFRFDDTWHFGGKAFGAPWAIRDLAVDDAHPTRRIAVAAHHWLWGASLVALLDPH